MQDDRANVLGAKRIEEDALLEDEVGQLVRAEMSVSLSPEAQNDLVDLLTEKAGRELVLKAMRGPGPASYELLGRKALVWIPVTVVRQLARGASAALAGAGGIACVVSPAGDNG